PLSENEQVWMQQVVDQTIDRSFLGRYGSIDEQVNAITFLASDESSYITGSVLPVGGGDQG
ncbi:SDR family oxidoreductase, partial [Acinetobacter baumannii]